MKEFFCQKCGACCTQPGFVYLHEKEVEPLAEYLALSPYDFADKYCILMERRYLVLKKNPDETCLFLDAGKCSVYPVRPRQCRDFPLGWKTSKSLAYCLGIKSLND